MSGVNTPQVIAVIAANTILGKLEPSFGAWVDKDEEIAGIVLSCMTRASNDLAQRVRSLEAQLAAALKDKARLVEMVLNIDKERTLYARRLAWLHDCSGNMTDADGCEWGIFRVKNNKDGQVVEAWHTFSDFSDLDAEIRRDGWILPDIAATPHQGAEKHDVLLGPCACGAWHLPGDLTAQSIDEAIAAAQPRATPGKLEGEA
jgi:hypothetical protein